MSERGQGRLFFVGHRPLTVSARNPGALSRSGAADNSRVYHGTPLEALLRFEERFHRQRLLRKRLSTALSAVTSRKASTNASTTNSQS